MSNKNEPQESEVQEKEQKRAKQPDSSEDNDSQENQKPEWFEHDDPYKEAKHWKGIAERNKSKIQKLEEAMNDNDSDDGDSEQPKKADNELGYDKKAYLRAEGIEKEDFGLVEEYMQNTGKDLDSIIESKYFQQDLKERVEQRKTQNATPDSSDRGGGAAQDSVDYWIQKGELPPKSETDLRRKVINEKTKRAKQGGKSKFTDNPVG